MSPAPPQPLPELSDRLARIGAVPRGADLRAWSGSQRDTLRWDLVGWRDQGRVTEAEGGLRLAAGVWPDDPAFLLELLVLRSANPELDLRPELDRASPEALDYPEVAIFLGHRALVSGDLETARLHFGKIGDLPKVRLDPFAALYGALAKQAWLEPARLEYLSAAAREGDPLALPEAERLIEALSRVLVHSDRYEDLHSLVRNTMFLNQLEVPQNAEIVLRALERARPRLSVEGKVVHLELVLAVHQAEPVLPLVHEIMAVDESRGSARFARVGSVVASRLKAGALEREILTRFVPPPSPRTPLEAAQIAEIEGRRRARGLDRPLNVFVGFFGQMREPEATLPKAVQAVRAAFADTRYGAFDLRFALSTWPRTGGRALSLADSADFFSATVPGSVRSLLGAHNGATGQALAARLPNLVRLLVEHSKNGASRESSKAELEGYLPAGASVVTGSEADLETVLRPCLARSGRDHPAVINQFKMWSRIAALRDALSTHESAIGRPMDVCVLLRCDLGGLSGSLAKLAARAVSPYESTSIYYDHDQHAEFIEGAGDRYILGSRNSMLTLFGGYDHHFAVTQGSGDGPLTSRLSAHESLQSFIFLNGLTPMPAWSMRYHLHRSIPSMDTLQKALKADLIEGDPGLRGEIEAALAQLALQSAFEAR